MKATGKKIDVGGVKVPEYALDPGEPAEQAAEKLGLYLDGPWHTENVGAVLVDTDGSQYKARKKVEKKT
jgi:hypothetical protein